MLLSGTMFMVKNKPKVASPSGGEVRAYPGVRATEEDLTHDLPDLWKGPRGARGLGIVAIIAMEFMGSI